MIFKYNLDWESLGDLTSFELMQFVPLMYCLIVCRSKGVVTLLVTIMILAASEWMKSTIMSDLIFFRVLFIFEMWVLLSSIKFFLLSPLIGTITCFLDKPFIVILIWDFGLSLSLMIFWIFSIFFTWRDGKASFILRTSSVLPLVLVA